MIKKQFVTRDIAILLEKIGCNERFGDYECTYYYKDELLCFCNNEYIDVWDGCRFVKAPLWQQVIDWFWTNHSIIINIMRTIETTEGYKYMYLVEEWDSDDEIVYDSNDYFKTYEEAREAAILEAIKIVKGDKQ